VSRLRSRARSADKEPSTPSDSIIFAQAAMTPADQPGDAVDVATA
jgi:hypothetical protein